MSSEPGITPHDIAAAEINCWRGRCLDLFAKAEAAVDLALRSAIERGMAASMKHLTGQRLAEIVSLASSEARATDRQKQALIASLENWQALYAKRNFFAHGVATVLMDRHGRWSVQLDFWVYRTGREILERWSWNKDEALQFEADLEQCFKALSAQLGCFRSRLAPQPR